MIFVTVGNAIQDFTRLLKAIDQLAAQNFFQGEEVFIQSGNSAEFQANCCRQENFLDLSRFLRIIEEANLVICHAGAGTLLHVLEAGKVPVVMPRRRHYGEHIDDHQIELAKALASESKVVLAREQIDLPPAITEASQRNGQRMPAPPSHMLSLVDKAIEELLGQR